MSVHVHVYIVYSAKDGGQQWVILKYFKGFNPQRVEWLSGSRCNVVFSEDDDYVSKEALLSLSQSPLSEEVLEAGAKVS